MESTPKIRHLIRQTVLQTLFQLEINPEMTEEEAVYFSSIGESPDQEFSGDLAEAFKMGLAPAYQKPQIIKDSVEFLKQLIQGLKTNQEEIDQIIDDNMSGWNVSRIDRTNLLILRIATFELLFTPEIDSSIIMNEAIELAKEFSDEKSSKFINGVLQGIQNSEKEA